MPSLSGVYISSSGRALASTEAGQLVVQSIDEVPATLRADGEFWLCCDDGLAGRFGSPTKVVLRHAAQAYNVWVEPRGFSNGSNEYGLIAIPAGEEYSNLFIEITGQGEMRLVDSWTEESKFRCVEQ